MIIRSFPCNVKLICGIMYKAENIYDKAVEILKESLGPVDYQTNAFPFRFTQYYNEEMGSPLYKRFISFKRIVNPGSLVEIKLHCINVEKKFLAGEKRRINIDPGYISMANLVLFTTKDFSHRIYMGEGIYAEVTLRYIRGEFKDLEWTYPDYKDKSNKQSFIDIRNIYKNQISKENR